MYNIMFYFPNNGRYLLYYFVIELNRFVQLQSGSPICCCCGYSYFSYKTNTTFVHMALQNYYVVKKI